MSVDLEIVGHSPGRGGQPACLAFGTLQEMDAYRLYTVVPFLVKFIDNLTNIYVSDHNCALHASCRLV